MSLIEDPTITHIRIPFCSHYSWRVVGDGIHDVLRQASEASKTLETSLICTYCHIEVYFIALINDSRRPPVLRVFRYADMGKMLHPGDGNWRLVGESSTLAEDDAPRAKMGENGPIKISWIKRLGSSQHHDLA
jgi:hypothetical protein